jgi:AmmeMemoRadiSam system protein A
MLARQAMERFVCEAEQIDVPEGLPDRLYAPGAAFVTLHTRSDGQLRGCIGSIIAQRMLAEDIIHNAIQAAVRDPRFSPLVCGELEGVGLSVSILSEPAPLAYGSGEDLLRRIRPGVDGVILRDGPHQSTFLPSVWEQISHPQHFLENLCLKAGLPRDAYKSGRLEVFTYQAEVCEEPYRGYF